VQDLRKQAELSLDARIRLYLDGPPEALDRLEPYLASVAGDVLADDVRRAAPPPTVSAAEVTLDAGQVRIALEDVRG
jgi:hypothetical protein